MIKRQAIVDAIIQQEMAEELYDLADTHGITDATLDLWPVHQLCLFCEWPMDDIVDALCDYCRERQIDGQS